MKIKKLFPDESLAGVIAHELDKKIGDSVTTEELHSITLLELDLDCEDYHGIKSIEGVQYLVNLRELVLACEEIPSLLPLADLPNLEFLGMMGCIFNRGLDLSPLARLTSLRRLILDRNELRNEDISFLKDLVNLKMLSLRDNQLSDLSPLAELTSLEYLVLHRGNISDISPLKNLTELRELDLGDNNISDISSLRGLTNLMILHLDDNRAGDLSPLSELRNLHSLSFSNGNIRDLTPLRGLSKLRGLNLSCNKIEDISPLTGLKELHALRLVDNPIPEENLLRCALFLLGVSDLFVDIEDGIHSCKK